MGLRVIPITIKAAKLTVLEWHRHHRPSSNHLWAVAVARDGEREPCGTAIVARPSSRVLEHTDPLCCEVVRVTTDGTRNACSMLYSAAWRAARSLGWRRMVTYILPSEGGASLRAAGWRLMHRSRGGRWTCSARHRVDDHPLGSKLRWEVAS